MQRQSWANIPDGSTLAVKVDSTDPFTAVGRITIDGTFLRSLSHDDLTNDVSLTLRSPHILVLEIDVFLNGKATVTVNGGVTDPSGETHGSPLNKQVKGVNGDHDTIVLNALTAL